MNNTNEMKTKYCDTQDVVIALTDGGKLVRIIPAEGDIIRYSVYDGNSYVGHSAGVVFWWLKKQGNIVLEGTPTKDKEGNTYETYKCSVKNTARRISKWLDK